MVTSMRPPVQSITTRDVEQLSASLDALQTVVRELKEIIVGRPDLGKQVPMSSTIQYILDYRERYFVYIISPVALTLSIEDYGTLSVAPNNPVSLPYPASTRIFATNITGVGVQQMVYILCTDHPTGFYSGSAGLASAVNISQIGGIATQMGSTGVLALGNSPEAIISLADTGTGGTAWQDAKFQAALANSGYGMGSVGTWVFNGTSWDAFRGNLPIPDGAIPLTGSSGTIANGTATATLAASATLKTWITGFEITGTGATGALVVSPTVTGVVTGTLTYTYVFVAGATTLNQPLIVPFPTPIPSSAINTAIAVSCPASGAGGTNNTVVAHGYQF